MLAIDLTKWITAQFIKNTRRYITFFHEMPLINIAKDAEYKLYRFNYVMEYSAVRTRKQTKNRYQFDQIAFVDAIFQLNVPFVIVVDLMHFYR